MKLMLCKISCVFIGFMWFAPTHVVCVGGSVVDGRPVTRASAPYHIIVLCLGHNARIDHNPDAKLKSILKA